MKNALIVTNLGTSEETAYNQRDINNNNLAASIFNRDLKATGIEAGQTNSGTRIEAGHSKMTYDLVIERIRTRSTKTIKSYISNHSLQAR